MKKPVIVQDCLTHHGMDEHQPDKETAKKKKGISMYGAAGQAEMVKI